MACAAARLHRMGAPRGRRPELARLAPAALRKSRAPERGTGLRAWATSPEGDERRRPVRETGMVRLCLGPRPRRLNSKRGNNPAKQVASDACLRNAPEAKSGSFNCARKNRRSDVPAALAFTRRASNARDPKQGLRRAGYGLAVGAGGNRQDARRPVMINFGPCGPAVGEGSWAAEVSWVKRGTATLGVCYVFVIFVFLNHIRRMRYIHKMFDNNNRYSAEYS